MNIPETMEELIEILDREIPNWYADWKGKPLDAAVGECLFESHELFDAFHSVQLDPDQIADRWDEERLAQSEYWYRLERNADTEDE